MIFLAILEKVKFDILTLSKHDLYVLVQFKFCLIQFNFKFFSFSSILNFVSFSSRRSRSFRTRPYVDARAPVDAVRGRVHRAAGNFQKFRISAVEDGKSRMDSTISVRCFYFFLILCIQSFFFLWNNLVHL